MSTPLHKPEILRQWRVDANLSQEALANEAKLSRPTVARAELGLYVSLQSLIVLSTTLNRNINDLITDDAQKKFASLVPAA